MMNDPNPYAANESAIEPEYWLIRPARMALGLFAALGTILLLWIVFIIAFVGDSKETSPGIIALAFAVPIGLPVFRTSTRSSLPFLLGLSVLSSSFLTTMLVIGHFCKPKNLQLWLVPDANAGFQGFHWFLLVLSIIAISFGIGLTMKRKRMVRTDERVACAIALLPPIGYLIWWLIGGADAIVNAT